MNFSAILCHVLHHFMPTSIIPHLFSSSPLSQYRHVHRSLECDHKKLIPLKYNDFLMFLILFVVLALSSAAGIGGGGLIIPLMLITNQLQPFYSVPLSVTSIVGGSIVRFLVQVYHMRLLMLPWPKVFLHHTLASCMDQSENLFFLPRSR